MLLTGAKPTVVAIRMIGLSLSLRRAGERERAALPVLQHDVEVLPGDEVEPLAARQGQQHLHHVLGEQLQAGDPCLRAQHRRRHAGFQRMHVDFQRHFVQRGGAAHQCLAARAHRRGQHRRLVRTLVDLALQHRAHAHAAAAIAAVVRQHQARAQARVQQGFARPRGHLVAAGMHFDAQLAACILAPQRHPRQQKEQQQWQQHNQVF